MIPGSDSAPADPVVAEVAGDRVVPPPRGRPRPKLVVGVVVLLGVIFAAGVLVSHGPKQAVVTTSLSTMAPASVPNAASKPTAAQRAHAAAARLAAKLPVELESAGVVRVGKSLYVVGGKARHGGKPADTILRMTLPSGRVRVVGRFIEPLTDAGAASRGGVLYLAGGWTGEKVATAVLRWSPGQTATLVTRLPVGLRAAKAAFVGGRLYVAGGSPRAVFAVDLGSGTVVRAATTPPQLHRQGTNLAYLAAALARP
jgi:hypothetical protein